MLLVNCSLLINTSNPGLDLIFIFLDSFISISTCASFKKLAIFFSAFSFDKEKFCCNKVIIS